MPVPFVVVAIIIISWCVCACIPNSGIEVGSSTVKEGKVYQLRQKQLDVGACEKGLKMCGVRAKNVVWSRTLMF